MAYHIGLLKDGKKLVIQVADSVDQLSCELWRYCGQRATTISRLKRVAPTQLANINRENGTQFTSIVVRRIGRSDFTAGNQKLRQFAPCREIIGFVLSIPGIRRLTLNKLQSQCAMHLTPRSVVNPFALTVRPLK